MVRIKNLSNSFIVYAILALSGGFMDAYSYLGRDKVFANSQTGNLLLLGVNIAERNWNLIPRYGLPVLFFTVGIALAASLKYVIKKYPKLCSLFIALIEALIMFGVMFISTEYNLLANSLISFACGMQVEHFRRLENQSIATTMCIGNLRAGTSALCKAFFEKDMKHFKIGMLFYMTILTFIIGAICGNFTLKWLGQYSLCISGVLLLIICIIIIFDITYKRKDKEEKTN